MDSCSRERVQRQAQSFREQSFFKSATLRGQKKKFEDSAIAGVFAGYETTPGYGWPGIYLVWKLEDCVNVELRQNSHVINMRRLLPHIVRELEHPYEGIVYPLKAEYEMVNNTMEGLRSGTADGILELPAEAGEHNVVARVPDNSDRW